MTFMGSRSSNRKIAPIFLLLLLLFRELSLFRTYQELQFRLEEWVSVNQCLFPLLLFCIRPPNMKGNAIVQNICKLVLFATAIATATAVAVAEAQSSISQSQSQSQPWPQATRKLTIPAINLEYDRNSGQLTFLLLLVEIEGKEENGQRYESYGCDFMNPIPSAVYPNKVSDMRPPKWLSLFYPRYPVYPDDYVHNLFLGEENRLCRTSVMGNASNEEPRSKERWRGGRAMKSRWAYEHRRFTYLNRKIANGRKMSFFSLF